MMVDPGGNCRRPPVLTGGSRTSCGESKRSKWIFDAGNDFLIFFEMIHPGEELPFCQYIM